MARLRPLIAALALGAAALPPMAAGAQAAAAPAPDPQADRLVGLVFGDEALVRAGARAFDVGLDQKIAEDKNLATLFARDPGLKPHVASRLRESMMVRMRQALPALRAQLGAIVAADMTAAEIADTITFFSSPIGKKLVAKIYQTVADNPTDAEAAQNAAMQAVLTDLAPEDYPPLIAFGASPAAQKLQVVNPKLAATARAWTEKFVADNEAALTQEAMTTAAAYLAGRK